ncbi:selenocysteine synthase [Limnochorda pilosa]|uniref:L-seryl-tRNA(Sec) selenium transferase n=2 Tax=Limnochorda pilosa TaxID=1555112 RepID=A0A0K2SQD7_LIMPI|nr:selenocysteine synthase [Limnochorda pilosa]
MERVGRRGLPAVDRLLRSEAGREAEARFGHAVARRLCREVIETHRQAVGAGEGIPSVAELEREVREATDRTGRSLFRSVLNATGVVLHTNLGRAPLSDEAAAAATRAATGYSNLEFDLETGRRGSRHRHGELLLQELTGAEAAMVVNNNAAAVLLVLSAVASGREVLLSRGEMVEIGGSFRIPDVMEQSGCRLREVGTTNRTRLADYERAIGLDTGAVLKVHQSNFRQIGFTESVESGRLAELAHGHGLPFIEDLGSGVLVETRELGLEHEPMIQEVLRAGADLVTASGDKLLGGPQAGLILGRRRWVDACRRHPLARAVRVDKMTLAALQATLLHYLRGEGDAVPIWRMLRQPLSDLRARAERLAARVAGALPPSASARAAEGRSPVGGGSLPGQELATAGLELRVPGELEDLARRLRWGEPSVVGRVEGDRLFLDLRTVRPEEDDLLLGALFRALDAGPGRHGEGQA